ncbi:MAG: amino acid adenylation domain-containing protein, partial [Candidatus Aminicenantes bacterium]|nr:amino acid adenylation domain-containing protein [Candidatus Aminicenantes bacterium]
SGGAYLPIDPNYPQERIAYMLKDSNAKILLGMEECQKKIIVNCQLLIVNDKLLMGAPRAPFHHSSFSVHHSNHLAYIIYTSGSTGKPKGVMVQTVGLLNLLRWYIEEFDIREKDNNLLIAPVGFDLSQKNLFSPFLTGGRLTLASPGVPDYLELAKLIHKEHITIINCAPSVIYPLMDSNDNAGFTRLHSLRAVILGGEPIRADRLLPWVDSGAFHCEIINTYGPTECTDIASFYRIPRETFHLQQVIPIGSPIPNVKVYILDKYLGVLPVGIPGELCIGGIGLSRGYFNNIPLTLEKFAAAPHLPGKKVYRTGDLTRWLPDGNIEFSGRIDHQVKIRGFRVELGEIESRLAKYPGIKEAVVTVQEEEKGDNYLCAYVVSDREYGISELREHLSMELPDYMIPAYFVPLEKIPLTPNGKIDRKALPDPRGNSLVGNIEYIPPQNAVENKLVEIWEKVLGRNNIGINENFFLVGGDSIKSIQVISRMSSAGYKLEMKDLFLYPVIADLAPRVKKLKRIPEQSTITGVIPLTPIQGMFFQQSHIDSHHYNQAVMLYSKKELDKEILKKVFTKIQEHHDVLRMTYKINPKNGGNGEAVQTGHGLNYPLSMDVYDLRNRETG